MNVQLIKRPAASLIFSTLASDSPLIFKSARVWVMSTDLALVMPAALSLVMSATRGVRLERNSKLTVDAAFLQFIERDYITDKVLFLLLVKQIWG
jgi:hypothetical protein